MENINLKRDTKFHKQEAMKKELFHSSFLSTAKEGQKADLELSISVGKITGAKRKSCDFSELSVKKRKLNKIEGNLSDCSDFREWKNEELVAELSDVSQQTAKNVITLLNQDCTIPFIARYRRDMTGGLSAEKLRDIQDAHENIKVLDKKVNTIVKTLGREGKLEMDLMKSLSNAKTMAEIEYLYAPYKSGCKRTLAERARKLGLENISLMILSGSTSVSAAQIGTFIQTGVKGLSNKEEILGGIQHIIASVISKEREVLDYLRKMSNEKNITITSTKSATAEKEDRKAFVEGKETQNFKFENYYSFSSTVKNIRAHQIMALNRGEKLKVLKVNICIPPHVRSRVIHMCNEKWGWHKRRLHDEETAVFINKCIQDAYDRLLEPHARRQIRSELTKQGEKESVSVFCTNLKHLLLTPPLRGKTVLGIDPGYKHGCKLAVVSSTGEVLQTDLIYLHRPKDSEQLKALITKHKCEFIALGNGTACRDTESYLSNLIKVKYFAPIDAKYCITNESGASIYSVTKEAEAELPSMDPNLRSAVSIARRLQNPLFEYVKVEPKHLGVGMYQHDISETVLKNALDGVVVECVSFVGVDLNVCPEIVLRKIAGLNSAKAKNIVEWREKNGFFKNRQQLLLIKGLGPKSFEQCAGFVKIFPPSYSHENIPYGTTTLNEGKGMKECEPAVANKRRRKRIEQVNTYNPLDMTIIHPESYTISGKLLQDIGCSLEEIGQTNLIQKITSISFSNAETLAKKYGTSVPNMHLIIDALKQPLEYDIRTEFDKPLFKQGVTSLEDLKIGTVVTGRIVNTTHFGAFVDIGVGQDGLVHISKMKGQQVNLGDRVEVCVLSVDIKKKRIGLELKCKV